MSIWTENQPIEKLSASATFYDIFPGSGSGSEA